MTLAANAIQKAIYERLVSQLTVSVYDFVPQDVEPPYVVIGADTSIPDRSKTEDGQQFTCTIHAWDSPRAGRKGVKAILGVIYAALDRQEDAMSVPGYQLVEIRYDFHDTFQEAAFEGDTDHHYHGVMRFRALVTDN